MNHVLKRSLGLILPILAACSGGHNKKSAAPLPPNPPGAECEGSQHDGEMHRVTAFTQARTAFGDDCAKHQTKLTATCKAGLLSLDEPGTLACENAKLTALNIAAAAATFVTGKSYALSLSGTDQWQQRFPVAANQATWTASAPQITVTADGVVTASALVPGASVTATIGSFQATFLLPLQGLACGPDFNHGASYSETLYTAEVVPFNAACEDMEVKHSCDNGVVHNSASGFKSCRKATVTALSVVSGASPLTLLVHDHADIKISATDSAHNTFEIDPKLLTWTASDARIHADGSGRVVAVSGENFSATVTVALSTDRSITTSFSVLVPADTAHQPCGVGFASGTTRTASRYASALVDFNSICAADVPGTESCSNAAVTFTRTSGVGPVFASCSVDAVTSIRAETTALSLHLGTGKALKELKILGSGSVSKDLPLKPERLRWTAAGAGLALVNDHGTATLLGTQPGTYKLSAVYAAATGVVLTTDISVAVTVDPAAVKALTFKKPSLLLQPDGVAQLEFTAKDSTAANASDLPVNAEDLSWQSSDPSKVSVEAGQVKAHAAGDADITVSLGELSSKIKVTVEATLTIKLEQSPGVVLTKDNLMVAAVAGITVAGPIDGELKLASADPACLASLKAGAPQWFIALRLNDANDSLPDVCQLTISGASKAGQTIKAQATVPVSYAKSTLSERSSRGLPTGAFEVARLSHKLSANTSVANYTVDNSVRTAEGCTFFVVERSDYASVQVRVDSEVVACAAVVVAHFKGSSQPAAADWSQLVTYSPYKTFQEYCEQPETAGIAATVAAVRRVTDAAASCEKIQDILRQKSSESVTIGSYNFPLVLSDSGLTDLAPLARLVGVSDLDLDNNPKLADISPLNSMKFLNKARFYRTAVSDFTPLFPLVDLNSLRLPLSDMKIDGCDASVNSPAVKNLCK